MVSVGINQARPLLRRRLRHGSKGHTHSLYGLKNDEAIPSQRGGHSHSKLQRETYGVKTGRPTSHLVRSVEKGRPPSGQLYMAGRYRTLTDRPVGPARGQRVYM